MNDFISRREAIEKIKEEGILGSGHSDMEREDDVIDMLNDILAADVQPVKRGKWERGRDSEWCYYEYTCSECKCDLYRHTTYHGDVKIMNYCPNCGAKMESEDKQ